MTFTYEYPRPTVTIDAVVLRPDRDVTRIEILLIRRGHEPFTGCLALPGGFLEMDETPLTGAARELKEETGISGIPLAPLFACGEPGRDPRARCITLVYGALVSGVGLAPRGSDDAVEASWFPLFDPPKMAFDHARAIREITAGLRWQARTAVIGRTCLPDSFRPEALRALHALVCPESARDDDPAERGLRLGLLKPAGAAGELRFSIPPQTDPDWHPLPW
ncbi:MAG: Bifunctional NMN adenylyltransferase/Nudix hydrolase [bacterium ADurb.Bin374]|nr:MAG: Bifunctional NMN adenylyltransferase/Nudix hydrolase [bacterium ADurb.Bin374]